MGMGVAGCWEIVKFPTPRFSADFHASHGDIFVINHVIEIWMLSLLWSCWSVYWDWSAKCTWYVDDQTAPRWSRNIYLTNSRIIQTLCRLSNVTVCESFNTYWSDTLILLIYCRDDKPLLGVIITLLWPKYWYFKRYITPRVEHFLTEFTVNMYIITLKWHKRLSACPLHGRLI